MSDFLRAVGRDLFDQAVAEGEAILAAGGGTVDRETAGKAAIDEVGDRLHRAARRSAFHAVKQRARDYLRRPMEMDSIDARLPYASPHAMLAIGDHHLDAEVRRRRRMIGLGGEVPIVNARAVRVAARWLRRFERGDALVAAE